MKKLIGQIYLPLDNSYSIMYAILSRIVKEYNQHNNVNELLTNEFKTKNR